MNVYKFLKKIYQQSVDNSQFSQEDKTRFQHFTLFLLVGLPIMFVFGVVNAIQGNTIVSLFCGLSALGLISGWIIIKSTEQGKIIYRINSCLFLALLTYLVIFGGVEGSKVLWMYIFPLISFFLFGKNEGVFWGAISTLILLGLLYVPVDAIPVYSYHPEFKLRLVASYVTVVGITYWFEYLRYHYSSNLAVQNEALNREISERKEIEQERERLIEEVQLASKAKSEFLANMSHEIRTPLNGVIGMTSLLLETKLSDEQHKHVRTLKKSGEFLLTIINDILDVSKIEAGKLELSREAFNLYEMLDDFCEIASQKVFNSAVELVAGVVPGTYCEVIGDSDRLQQILLNLTSNGLKFTEEGTVSIEIQNLKESANHILLKFSVKDSGIGISESDTSLLFKNFSQLDGSMTREHSGTGLGLAISKMLCELMDGEIGVNSTVGVGSEFWFTARLVKNLSPKRIDEDFLPDLSGKTGLLAVPNMELLHVISRQLGYWRAKTIHLADSAELMNVLNGHTTGEASIDFLIVDQSWLSVDGGTSRSIEKFISARNVRVILLAGQAYQSPVLSGGKGNSMITVEKPVKYRDLVRSFSEKESNQQQGASFSFSQSEDNMVHENHPRKAGKILLAEDNSINQQVMSGVLSKLGYGNIDIVDNGLDVLSVLDRKEYDLILMDISMPKMDGLTATENIRKKTFACNNSKIPILALTAHAIVGDREKCLAAGMNDYLTKPINPQKLMQKIELLLGDNREEDSEPAHKEDNLAVSPSSSLAVFDYNTMLGRLMGDKEVAREIMQMFVDDMPEQVHDLKTLIVESNFREAQQQAHKLVGASANLEAQAFSATARKIEEQLRKDESSGLDQLCVDLEKNFQEVKRAMEICSDY